MKLAHDRPPHLAHEARLDLYGLIVGETGAGQKLEVMAVYIHGLASPLPPRVIKKMLEEEFEPLEMRLVLSHRLEIEAGSLDARFLQQVHEVSLNPLRRECYGAPPQSVTWYFFAVKDVDALAGIARKLAE
jgi:hypothetical protein